MRIFHTTENLYDNEGFYDIEIDNQDEFEFFIRFVDSSKLPKGSTVSFKYVDPDTAFSRSQAEERISYAVYRNGEV